MNIDKLLDQLSKWAAGWGTASRPVVRQRTVGEVQLYLRCDGSGQIVLTLKPINLAAESAIFKRDPGAPRFPHRAFCRFRSLAELTALADDMAQATFYFEDEVRSDRAFLDGLTPFDV